MVDTDSYVSIAKREVDHLTHYCILTVAHLHKNNIERTWVPGGLVKVSDPVGNINILLGYYGRVESRRKSSKVVES